MEVPKDTPLPPTLNPNTARPGTTGRPPPTLAITDGPVSGDPSKGKGAGKGKSAAERSGSKLKTCKEYNGQRICKPSQDDRYAHVCDILLNGTRAGAIGALRRHCDKARGLSWAPPRPPRRR